MYTDFQKHLQQTLQEIKDAGLYKNERVIITPQSSGIAVEGGQEVINFCANNYLGLADNKELIEAAKARMDARGYGMASVRFICGTQDTHKELERVISDFFGTEDTILYAACFDANGGLFEPLLTEEDAIISDALNHASIIDGVRLCKAVRYRYANGDMNDLEAKLKEAQAQRFRIIATDGVFSMDGNVCPLDKIYELAQIALCVGLISKPAAFMRSTKYAVFSCKRSCNSLLRVNISNVLIPAAAIIGGIEFENRYGLER